MTFLRGSLLMISSTNTSTYITNVDASNDFTSSPSLSITADGYVKLGEDFTITVPQLIAVLKYALPKAEKDYPEEFI